jgi:hypothetical protein
MPVRNLNPEGSDERLQLRARLEFKNASSSALSVRKSPAPNTPASSSGKRILDPSRQLKTIEQGAATQVWCATSSRLNGLGSVYCENVDIARVVPPDERSGWASDDSSRKVSVMPSAIDPVSAERLWSVSVEMTGASARP